MLSQRKGNALFLTVLLFLATLPCVVQAQISTHVTYDDQIKKSRSFTALDENLFGDKISLQDGAVSFTQDDVVLDTNSNLKVAIGRMTPTRELQANTPQFNVFGYNWDLNVPYMMATYDTRDGWNTNLAADTRRCRSGLIRPGERTGPWPYYYTQSIYAHMYWKGIQINIPGYGNEQMLKLNAGQALPSDGKNYYATTKSRWKIGCLDSVSNGTGEGFTVLLPDGVTYYFDWMVKRKAVDLTDNHSTDSAGNGTDPWHLLAPLTDVYLYASKAVDRFGNTVTYTYDQINPQRIKTIESNDGVRLDVQYTADGLISTVTSQNRVWTYGYNGTQLASLQLPDGSKWQFSNKFYDLAGSPSTLNFWLNGCAQDPGNMNAANSPAPNSLWTVSITHPSGAKGDFTFRPLYHGINKAPGGCGYFGDSTSGYWGTWGVPSAYGVMSLYQKKISGPGMSDRTWDYSYAPSWSFQSQCSNGCASTSSTSVITNDGVKRRFVYGNDYFLNQGQLLSESVEKNGLIVSAKTFTYLTTASGQPFPDNNGDIAKANGAADLYGNPFRFKNRPLSAVTTLTDGVTFTRTHAAFDLFARPSTTIKQNSLGYSKTEVTEYHDDLSLWVLGQIKRQYVPNSNPNADPNQAGSMVASQTDYDAKALPWKTYAFGKLQSTMIYSADGTLATVADGRGNVTTLSQWKRGIPQLTQFPATPEATAGSTKSATVNDNGWITSVTDELGYVTGYGYDVMGRLASIVYPTGDSVGYHNTTRAFQALTDVDWKPAGVSNGQWRIYEATGSRVKFTYMDAMWRPVLVHEYDANNIGPTLRASRTTYDTSGRVNFQSYPSSDVIPGATGTRTFYDALDRVTRVEQDSELGVLATTTEYLAGLKIRVTNPRNFQTTTSYMAWDQPGYDMPIKSEQPEGKLIEITRHPQFGWPQKLKQRNTSGSLQASRQYVYDGNAQLCKTIEPETGVAVTGYDAAGNPNWSASGLSVGSFSSATDCQQSAAYGTGLVVTREYDARNRLTQLKFPDGRGDQIWTYEKDSLPASITAYNDPNNTTPVITAYNYNKRRLLTGESVTQPQWYTWSIGYTYDAYANLSTQSYPTGLIVDYAPNPLGQPTKAGIFASGAQYYPNGALKQFTYGNGIVHTMTQNTRQLPVRVIDSGNAVDYDYGYDSNGNIERIYDYVTGTPTARHRWMGYDGLDRLTSTSSAVFGGSDNSHRFTYDALDNLKSWKLAGVKDYADYVYDAQNRLTNIRNTAGATVVGLSYDPQGNLANKNGQAYGFDYGNRLREVSGKEYYRYDGLGRRVLAWEPTTNSILSQYSQSGQIVYQENHRNSIASENIYLGGSVIAIRERAFTASTYSTKYQHTDALGSPVAMTNEAGAVIERNDYEPYGAVIGQPNKSGIGYTGHVMDGGTGLTYMQQRYYDQSLGRFLSVDPVTAHEKPGENFNRYWYANNNPYRFTDPDGREIRPTGTRAEIRTINRALRKIEISNPASRARMQELRGSAHVHTIRFPQPGEAPENKTTGVRANESVPGVGTGSETIVDPTASVTTINTDGTPITSSGETVLTHELLGHGGDKDKGVMDRSINSATGERKSEERAMDAENEYKDAVGEPRRDCHSTC
jgi:RHS repeat-associated protein